jgi:hypothetical protein
VIALQGLAESWLQQSEERKSVLLCRSVDSLCMSKFQYAVSFQVMLPSACSFIVDGSPSYV